MTDIFLDLVVTLGCAILFGLICIVLAITWSCIQIIVKNAKEVVKPCSPAKTVQTEKSDAILDVKNTEERNKNTKN